MGSEKYSIPVLLRIVKTYMRYSYLKESDMPIYGKCVINWTARNNVYPMT